MLSRLKLWLTAEDAPSHLPRRLFWTGLLLRVLYLTLAHTYRIRLFQDHFQFGWEMGRIARALATGHGYADPFVGHTGPTAWCPPLYPLLIAAAFKLFGVYSPLSAWVILTVNSVFSAATAVLVYRIAQRVFNPRVALWSAWFWALYPAAMQYAVHWIWDMAITTCLFTAILLIALITRNIGTHQLETRNSHLETALWSAFGLIWGLIALLNPSLLLFLPACGLWMAWPLLRTPGKLLARAALAAVLCSAVLTPWVLRNWNVFHAFIPTRGNLGAELYQSILEEHQGFPWGTTIPYLPAHPEFRAYQTLGEVAYVHQKDLAAKALIATHHRRFAAYALKRVYFFWVGVPHPIEHGFFLEWIRELNYAFGTLCGLFGLALALRRRVPGSILFLYAFSLTPIAFYLLTVQARFRAPLEPLICILGVYLFQSATRPKSINSLSS